jgi:hypothetical protein
VKERCLEARQEFYSLPSIFKRSLDFKVNSGSLFMWWNFFFINLLFRREVMQRKDFPLGDEAYTGELIKAVHSQPLDLTPINFANGVQSTGFSRNGSFARSQPAEAGTLNTVR